MLTELAERVFVAFAADVGDWTVELHGSDGRLRKWRRQQSGGRHLLEGSTLAAAAPMLDVEHQELEER